MGHYWREMDPVGTDEHDKRMSRLSNLQKKIQNMRLSNFTVSDLGTLCRLMNIIPKDAGEEEIADFERKVRQITKKS